MSEHQRLFDELAGIVCGKPVGMTHTACMEERGHNKSFCRDHDTCRLHEKSLQQLAYVVSEPRESSLLKACPGSGKTEVVGIRAASWIRQWANRGGGIAVLTFTNSAADIIRERVVQFAGAVGYPHFVGTFDSWLHGYLANPFAHVLTGYPGREGDCSLHIVDPASEHPFLHAYRTKYQYAGTGHIRAHEYELHPTSPIVIFQSGDRSLDGKRNHLGVTKRWQVKDFLLAKRRFWRAGYATLQDVELISGFLIRRRPKIARRFAARFPLIVVDECQDLSKTHLAILARLNSEGCVVHLVGDLDQAIYSFKGIYPEDVDQFVMRSQLRTSPMGRNFRSVQSIVDLCGHLVRQPGKVIGNQDGDQPACILFTYDPSNLSALVQSFHNYLVFRHVALSESAVLARGHGLVNRLRATAGDDQLKHQEGLATAVHVWPRQDSQSMDTALFYAGRLIAHTFFDEAADSRSYYCPQSYSSRLAWRLFLAQFLDRLRACEAITNFEQTWTDWTREVRTRLAALTREAGLETCAATEPEIRFSAPSGKAQKRVSETIEARTRPANTPLRITTIHQAKGETLEATLLVSGKSSSREGGYWRQWLDPTSGNGEHARLAYVASSRPKTLLAWAIPQRDKADCEQLEEMGFVLAPTDDAGSG